MLKRPRHISKTLVDARIQAIESSSPPLFRGNSETISSLYDFIHALQSQRDTYLTTKQTKALIKVAEALISYIKAGGSPSTSGDNIISSLSTTGFKRTLARHVPAPVRERMQTFSVPS